MTRMTTKTTIKKKAKLGSCFYRVSLLSTQPWRLPSYSLHRICNPPPALSSFYWGKTVLEGWAKWSCIVIKPPPLPMELRATQQPSTSLPPSPVVLRHPSTQHSTISLSTPRYVSRVRTLGLVFSFWVCAFNILLNDFFLSLLFLVFFFPPCSLFSFPDKIIAIAAVQPASQDF